MKKSKFVFAIVWSLVGVCFLLASIQTESRLDGLLCGLAGGCLGTGLMGIWRYCYWNRPGKQEQYISRMEEVQIQQQDERNIMIRDRARGGTLVISTLVISISMLVFCLLDALEIPAAWSSMIFYLAGLLILQYSVYAAFFHKLQKKY